MRVSQGGHDEGLTQTSQVEERKVSDCRGTILVTVFNESICMNAFVFVVLETKLIYGYI